MWHHAAFAVLPHHHGCGVIAIVGTCMDRTFDVCSVLVEGFAPLPM